MSGLPTTGAVAAAWVEQLAGLGPSAMLPPEHEADWPAGFIQVHPLPGGVPDRTGLRAPVVALDVVVQGGDWDAAAQLAERLVEKLTDPYLSVSALVTLPDVDDPVRIIGIKALSECYPVYGDPRGYARYSLSAQLHWRSKALEGA